jgi:hypothetical protein
MTAFTRMPSPTWSAAIARVSEATAPLLAAYTARCGRPTWATIELTLTIAALGEERKWGRAARDTRAMPKTLTSKTRRHSSSELAATSPTAPMPALLTTMSRRPYSATTAAIALSTDAGSVTSQGNLPPARSRPATVAPRAVISSAVAEPMPPAAPVMTATRPSKSDMRCAPNVGRWGGFRRRDAPTSWVDKRFGPGDSFNGVG